MQAAIQATDLQKTYPGPKTALDGVSFEVPEGTIFGLLGPNGAGKSTTVKVLTTLSAADGGSARVAGFDVLSEARQVRGAIGVVGQSSAVDKEATGRENLELQGQLYGIRGQALQRRVDELLERLGLSDDGKRIAKGYSGGMKRRLDIAMGLIHQPSVLFLDEPTTGLDPEVRAMMWERIRQLNTEDGLTILLTTHYLEEADQLAQQLALIDRGRVVVEGSPSELKAELQGDAVQVEISTDDARARAQAALAAVEGVREIQLHQRSLHARADDGAAALPAVLAALNSAGVPVAAATVARPSLDDVYVRYAGRSFEEADRRNGNNADTERNDR